MDIAKLVEPLVEFLGSIHSIGEGLFSLLVQFGVSVVIVSIVVIPFVMFWLMTRKFKVEKKK